MVLGLPTLALAGDGWVTPAVEAPGVTRQVFRSEAAGTEVSYHVWLPREYQQRPSARFPALYWLHGTGGGEEGIAPLCRWFQKAIRDGRIPPMILVFPNGLATSLWSDSKDGRWPVETVLVREVIPLVDRGFRTVATREGRLVEGFSMGGYGAARLGFRHPDVFGSVSVLAGGPLDLEFEGPRARANPGERQRILASVCSGDMAYFRALSPLTLAEANASRLRGRTRIRIAVGGRDFTREANEAFARRLAELRIDHELTTVPGVGHSTMALLRGLGEEGLQFYRKAFGGVTR